MVVIHVRNHALLLRAVAGSEGIGQGYIVQPVDRAEAADVAPAHGLQYPEIEIVDAVVIARFGKVAVIAPRGGLDDWRIDQLPRLGQQRQASGRLHILRRTLAHQQRAFVVGLEIAGVLGDTADQQQRPAVGIQAIRHGRAERKTGHRPGVGGEHTTVFLEQELSCILDGLCAHQGFLEWLLDDSQHKRFQRGHGSQRTTGWRVPCS